MTNPYWSLMRTAWHYARDQRKQYVLIYAMFLASNVLTAFEPIIWGWFINALQRDGVQAMAAAGWYVAAYLGLHFSLRSSIVFVRLPEMSFISEYLVSVALFICSSSR